MFIEQKLLIFRYADTIAIITDLIPNIIKIYTIRDGLCIK